MRPCVPGLKVFAAGDEDAASGLYIMDTQYSKEIKSFAREHLFESVVESTIWTECIKVRFLVICRNPTLLQ